ncbi:hypothetical protein RB594_005676 [Gaeumannomyces avenae]
MASLPPRHGALSIALVLQLLFLAVAAYKELSDSFLKAIPVEGADFDIHRGKLLSPILIPRVPGTPGQVKVQEHFVNFFKKDLPKWSIMWQNSTGTTPISNGKQIPFQNLIFRREPPWVRPGQANYLTLVAHYDSKITPTGFIGATDSAAPCAILMHVARSIDKYVTQMHDEMAALGEGGTIAMDMGVQIILLDGEEAFKAWTDTDSVYGARSLAAEWDRTFNPAMSQYKNPLEQISVFVLLDLLGTANPEVPSYFQTTHWAYAKMAKIEERMRGLKLLESKPNGPFFPDKDKTHFFPAGVGDDHMPFMMRGVDILHLIPSPFPMVWHTMNDDGDHLDLATVRDWTRITTAFALEWLDMMEVWPAEGKAGGR